MSFILAWLYAAVRATYGAVPRTAIAVGVLVGFEAGFPVDLSLAAWAPMGRAIPLGWLLDLGIGAVLAALVAAWLFRD